jgi:RNA polymerase sigma-70 factor (ECF subfamily)
MLTNATIYQKVYDTLFSHEGKYATTGKFLAWLMRIAHNVIMDNYRENRSKGTVDVAGDNDLSNISSDTLLDSNIENRFVNTQVLSDVKKMMNMLPTPQREVVFMRFYQNMAFKEIAEVTGVSINTSLGRMRYALLNMRRMARDNRLSLELVD